MIIDATTTKKVGLAICMNSLCTLSFLGRILIGYYILI